MKDSNSLVASKENMPCLEQTNASNILKFENMEKKVECCVHDL